MVVNPDWSKRLVSVTTEVPIELVDPINNYPIDTHYLKCNNLHYMVGLSPDTIPRFTQ